jgi:hypothetical protein
MTNHALDPTATVTGRHREVDYVIAPRSPFPGIGWKIRFVHVTGAPAEVTSAGAFYDGCVDHPEGAYAWAENAVRRFIDRMCRRD